MSDLAVYSGGTLLGNDNIYCSMKADTTEDKVKIFNAMNNPDKKLSECINEVLAIKDVYLEKTLISVKDDAGNATGEVNEAIRVVLIDENGVSYQSLASGVIQAVSRLVMLFGKPTWEDPIKIKVLQKSVGQKNRTFTFELV